MKRRQPPRRHACSRCVQLKVKCTIPEHGRVCERCARLRQQCDFPARIFTGRQRRSRVDRLQEQVDYLVGLNRQRDASAAQAPPNLSVTDSEANSSSLATATVSDLNPPEYRPYDPVEGGLISLEEADGLLDKFRIYKMPQFPFVVIRQDEVASTLRETYPFLFLAIMAVCTEDNLPLYHKLEQKINNCIYGIMDNWREMDLVLGLLVHTAWSHYKWKTVPNQQYLLLQIAVSILVDLRLDKGGYYGQDDFRPNSQPIDDRYKESIAGKRALLGYYYLFSMSSLFRRQMFMRYTNWTEECCQKLAKEREFQSDSLLKTYIEIQLLTHKGEGASAIANGTCVNCTSELDFGAVYRRHYEIAGGYRTHEALQGNWALYLHLRAIPTLVLGQALRYQRDVFKREKHQLQKLLVSAHDLLQAFLDIPLGVVAHLPSCSMATTWYCLLTLSKLSLLSNEDWCHGLNLDHEVSRELAHATLQKFIALSKGEDIWAYCKHIVGGMLSLLEKTKVEKRRNRNRILRSQPPSSLQAAPAAAAAASVPSPLYHAPQQTTTATTTTTASLLQPGTDATTQAAALSSSLGSTAGLFQPFASTMPAGMAGLMDGSAYVAGASDDAAAADAADGWASTAQLSLDSTGTATGLHPSEYLDIPTQDSWQLGLYERLLDDFSPSPPAFQMDDFSMAASGMFC